MYHKSLLIDDNLPLCEIGQVFLVGDKIVVVSKDYVSIFRASDLSYVSKNDFSSDQLLNALLGDGKVEIKDNVIDVLDYSEFKSKVAIFSTKILLLSDTNELIN